MKLVLIFLHRWFSPPTQNDKMGLKMSPTSYLLVSWHFVMTFFLTLLHVPILHPLSHGSSFSQQHPWCCGLYTSDGKFHNWNCLTHGNVLNHCCFTTLLVVSLCLCLYPCDRKANWMSNGKTNVKHTKRKMNMRTYSYAVSGTVARGCGGLRQRFVWSRHV